MSRPSHLRAANSKVNVKTKGIPSNSQDVIQAHAHAIEAYVHDHIGMHRETGEYGKMYFNDTLEDWIGFKINDRTSLTLRLVRSCSSWCSKVKAKKEAVNFDEKKFFRDTKPIG